MKKKRILFVLVILLLCGGMLTAYMGIRSSYPKEYTDLVEEYSAYYGLDENLVYAVIKTESNFREKAISKAEARGLMQLTEDTLFWLIFKEGSKADLNREHLYDPQINIRYGCYMLSLMLEEFSEEQSALAAYNAGRGRIQRWLKDPQYSDDGVHLKEIPIRETASYVVKVEKAKQIYEFIY